MTRHLVTKLGLSLIVAANLSVAIMTAASATTLHMAWAQDATGLDPHKQTAFSSLRLLELIYEPLVRLDKDLKITPAVAQSWQFAADGSALTFKLDPKAKFQNGAPVTSADVKATFERILDEKTGAVTRVNFRSISSIETPDPATVIFHLSEPDAPILTAMTSANTSIVPASAISGDTLATKAIGSGPFKLEKWEPNAKEELVANKEWAGGPVGVDAIEIRVLPDETAILAALRAGQLDFALLNDPLVAMLVPKEPNLTLIREPVLAYHALQLNASRGAMTKLQVRQAISCAVDRQDALDTALLGEGKVTGPLTMPAYASDPSALFCYKRDLAKAKQLMTEAGYADGFSATVIAATGEPVTSAAEAQVLQSQLAEIGIKLDIKMMELNVYVDAWLKGDFDMAIALNGGNADPFTMYNRYWTKNGNLQKVANYIDDTLDRLMQQGRVETDLTKRKVIFTALEKQLTETSPWIWLYTSYIYTAQQKTVSGFTATPTGSLVALAKVTIKP